MNNKDLILLKNELSADFGNIHATEFEAFRTELAETVFYYLKNDMKRLMSFLYRIDVLEKNFKAVMGNRHTLEVNALQIADLIIERSLKKIHFKKNTNWDDC